MLCRLGLLFLTKYFMSFQTSPERGDPFRKRSEWDDPFDKPEAFSDSDLFAHHGTADIAPIDPVQAELLACADAAAVVYQAVQNPEEIFMAIEQGDFEEEE